MDLSCTPSDDEHLTATNVCVAPSSSAPFAEGSGQPGSSREIHVSAIESSKQGDGSIERPFASITAALRGTAPGDYVIVHAGVYDECPAISDVHGTPEQPIWITGYGAVTVRCAAGAGLRLQSVSNLAVQHLRIETATRGASSILVAGQSERVRIGANDVDSITISNATDVVVSGNRIATAGGIVVTSSRDVLVSFNRSADDLQPTIVGSSNVRVECNSETQ